MVYPTEEAVVYSWSNVPGGAPSQIPSLTEQCQQLPSCLKNAEDFAVGSFYGPRVVLVEVPKAAPQLQELKKLL